jgi:hypothetical protein
MVERALKCSQCNAPLAAGRFARTAICPFCGSTVMLGEPTVPAGLKVLRDPRDAPALTASGRC